MVLPRQRAQEKGEVEGERRYMEHSDMVDSGVIENDVARSGVIENDVGSSGVIEKDGASSGVIGNAWAAVVKLKKTGPAVA